MEHYALLPEYSVDAPQELINACGSLYPFITTLSGAKRYARSVKKRFPNFTLRLLKGATWGDSELVEEF